MFDLCPARIIAPDFPVLGMQPNLGASHVQVANMTSMALIMNGGSGTTTLVAEVYGLEKDNEKEILDRFFAEMTDKQRDAIEAAAMGMWEPYINRVKHYCPNAKIVFYFFHFVQNCGRVIDKVRCDEYLKANK